MVLLANLVGSSPYFTLPVRIEDAYALEYATILRDQLRESKCFTFISQLP